MTLPRELQEIIRYHTNPERSTQSASIKESEKLQSIKIHLASNQDLNIYNALKRAGKDRKDQRWLEPSAVAKQTRSKDNHSQRGMKFARNPRYPEMRISRISRRVNQRPHCTASLMIHQRLHQEDQQLQLRESELGMHRAARGHIPI